MPLTKGQKKTNVKPFLCACGEDRPSMFYGDKKSRCAKCERAKNLRAYHEKQRARGIPSGPRKSGINPRESLKKPPPNDWTPEEIAAAAKFGLTVPQYREALRDRA